MKWLTGLLIIGALIAGNALDRRRRREQRLPRPEINRWEEEGGAVAAMPDRPAAQPSPF
jgi:hypothetical protein